MNKLRFFLLYRIWHIANEHFCYHLLKTSLQVTQKWITMNRIPENIRNTDSYTRVAGEWLHNWIATGPNKQETHTAYITGTHYTRQSSNKPPGNLSCLQRASKQRSSRCHHAKSGPVVRFNGWTQLRVVVVLRSIHEFANE